MRLHGAWLTRVATILIEATEIEFWRQDRCVLDRLSVHFSASEAVHVMGADGVGKTTLMRVLAGFLWPEYGTLRYRGVPYEASLPTLRRELFFLGHSHGLSADLTAFENLQHWSNLQGGAAPGELEQALVDAGVAECRDRAVRALSAGQKRRVSLARLCLAHALPVWILDEPWTNLDSDGMAWVLSLIDRRIESGGTVIFSAHAQLTFEPRGYRALAL